MICREKMKINYTKMKCTNRHTYAATIPGEASTARTKDTHTDNYHLVMCGDTNPHFRLHAGME